MSLAAESPLWLALVFAALLLAAAIQDAATLRISNLICGLILVAGTAAVMVVGPQLAVWQNVVVFAALLVVGIPLFAAGKFGGGDVKLFATTGLWFSFSGAFYLLAAVLISGGVLALLILGLRTFGWGESALRRVQVLRPAAGIPYGIAIAAGALITMALQRGYTFFLSPL